MLILKSNECFSNEVREVETGRIVHGIFFTQLDGRFIENFDLIGNMA